MWAGPRYRDQESQQRYLDATVSSAPAWKDAGMIPSRTTRRLRSLARPGYDHDVKPQQREPGQGAQHPIEAQEKARQEVVAR